MNQVNPVFSKIRQEYLNSLLERWEKIDTTYLGLSRQGPEIVVPYFHLEFRVSSKGILGPANQTLLHSDSVVIAKYLLGPRSVPNSNADWISFREYLDAAPSWQGYVDTVENRIAQAFSGRLAQLEAACQSLGGRPPEQEYSYDLCRQFRALPRLELLLLFNDADQEFPAQCSVLFQRWADHYLDMECLAMVGLSLTRYLKSCLPD